MRTIFAVMLLLVPAIAQADEADRIGDQAERCWIMPGDARDVDVTFDVVFDAHGGVRDITVVQFRPSGESGKHIVRSASLGIERCAPYSGTKEGLNRVRMRIEQDIPIDPFKK